jgi:hypothetical protein
MRRQLKVGDRVRILTSGGSLDGQLVRSEEWIGGSRYVVRLDCDYTVGYYSRSQLRALPSPKKTKRRLDK